MEKSVAGSPRGLVRPEKEQVVRSSRRTLTRSPNLRGDGSWAQLGDLDAKTRRGSDARDFIVVGLCAWQGIAGYRDSFGELS